MKREATGIYKISLVANEEVRSFIPFPLPPKPPLEISGKRQLLLERATLAIGRLDSIFSLLPNPHLFLYSYIRREAVLSSQIEGTQSSLSELLLFEQQTNPATSDVVEVSNYIAALEHGIKRLQEGFPLSNRLLREIHSFLMSRGRGSDKQPGEFRHSQNWIGGTRPGNAHFVPSPPAEVEPCMAALEHFIHDNNDGLPILLKTAMAHAQFETIHPFLDGNGRLGRLLIALLLHNNGLLSQPLLYLSLYLKKHRSTYYDLLDSVRKTGDWEKWIDFFLEGIEKTATDAVHMARRIVNLFESDTAKIQLEGRSASQLLRLFSILRERPILTLKYICLMHNISFPTASRAMLRLVTLGIVSEVSLRRRNRIFSYKAYLDIISEDQ